MTTASAINACAKSWSAPKVGSLIENASLRHFLLATACFELSGENLTLQSALATSDCAKSCAFIAACFLACSCAWICVAAPQPDSATAHNTMQTRYMIAVPSPDLRTLPQGRRPYATGAQRVLPMFEGR